MRQAIFAAVAAVLLLVPAAAAFAQGCDSYELAYGDAPCASALTASSLQARDGSRVEIWTFSGSANDCVDIQMTSTDFPPYLQLIQGSRTGPVVAEREGTLHVRLPSSGSYWVKATSAGRGDQRGSYELALVRC